MKKNIIKVEPKTKEIWISIFKNWTTQMESIYGRESNGMLGKEGALGWNENPADWMKPYNNSVFEAWLIYDASEPGTNWEDTIQKRLVK